MSGDVQPRKRKDKRKKKEDSVDEDIFTHLKHSTDEIIHVQKDIVCGGNVITKLVFFCLLATIGVMVGFILLEYRGSTDEETSSAIDSPWSVTFQDWVDQAGDAGHDQISNLDPHEEHETADISHNDDHGKHEENNHHSEESESGKGFSWILSLITFSSYSENENIESEAIDEDSEGGGLMSWFQFGDSGSDLEEDREKNTGGWFGFGSSQENFNEETEYQEEEEVVSYKTQDKAFHDEDLLSEDSNEEDNEEENVLYNKEEESGDLNEVEEDEEEENDYEIDHIGHDNKDSDEIVQETREDEEEDEMTDINDFEEEENELKDEESGEHDDLNNSEEEENELKDVKSDEHYDNFDDLNNSEEEEKDFEQEEVEDETTPVLDKGDKSNDEEEEREDQKDSDEELHFLTKRASEEEDIEHNADDSKEEQLSSFTVNDKEIEEIDEGEMFPEAVEALRQEAEKRMMESEILKEKVEATEDKFETESDLDSGNESLSEDNEEDEGMALKFGVGVALVVVAHIVLVKKWNRWANGDEISPMVEDIGVPLQLHEPVTKTPIISPAPLETESAHSHLPDIKPLPETKFSDTFVEEESAAEEEEEGSIAEEEGEEGSPAEEEGEEGTPAEEEGEEGSPAEEEDLEIDRKKFHDLLAKYGQETPESSDIEPSDEDVQRAEFSEGDESVAGDDEEREQDEAGSEDDLKEWTGIRKRDIEVVTDSEDEEEEVQEEESDDEAPPPPPLHVERKKAGQQLDEDYANTFITNDEDWPIREELDQADEEFNYEKARTLYQALLAKHPNSPRARYGLAQTFDKQAEKDRSNILLELAISGYKDALEAPNVTDILFIQIATRLINRLRFRGQFMNAVPFHNLLIQKFNSTPEYRTDLAITYLMVNRLEDARLVLKDLLRYWNHDPTALAHYGLVLKLQGNIQGCIKYFEEGLTTAHKPLSDSRLYFHYGDALTRIGRAADALKVYDSAVDLGLFRSRYQRSLYNVDHLTARPWWTHQETTYTSFLKQLEDNWKRIRDEGVNALKLSGMYKNEAEGLRDKGDWKQFELFARGSKIKKNCEVTPFTCSLIGSFEPAATCKRGQSKFSIMEAGTHVWPHCGPTNCRLRAHLGLIVPPGPKIRVANITKTWEKGKVIVFDDSFEHEVWHNGDSLRLVLIVDVWHPELSKKEKLSLSPI